MPLTSFAKSPPVSLPPASPPPGSSLSTTNGINENCENCKKNVIKEPEPVIIVDESQQKVIDSQQKTIDSQQKAIDDLKRQIEQYKTSEKQMNRYHDKKLIFWDSGNIGGDLRFLEVLNSFPWWNRVLNNYRVP